MDFIIGWRIGAPTGRPRTTLPAWEGLPEEPGLQLIETEPKGEARWSGLRWHLHSWWDYCPAPQAWRRRYPTLYVYRTYHGTKGFFRSSDAGANWDKIAGQYLPNNYIFANVKDIDGDKNTAGKVYMILGGNSLVYGVPKP